MDKKLTTTDLDIIFSKVKTFGLSITVISMPKVYP